MNIPIWVFLLVPNAVNIYLLITMIKRHHPLTRRETDAKIAQLQRVQAAGSRQLETAKRMRGKTS